MAELIRTLSPNNIEAAAFSLMVTPAHVQTIAEVEARGEGFLIDGRPKILFERHVMRRQLLLKRPLEKVNQIALMQPNLVNTDVGGYAKGPTADARGQLEHARMNSATAIDRAAALSSASWGTFQIMGYHWNMLGFSSIEAFVSSMESGAPAHLDALCTFVSAQSKMLKALREGNWAVFAREYNGPNYAKDGYHIKLAQAFDKFSGDSHAMVH